MISGDGKLHGKLVLLTKLWLFDLSFGLVDKSRQPSMSKSNGDELVEEVDEDEDEDELDRRAEEM